MTIEIVYALPTRPTAGDRLRLVLDSQDHLPASYTGTLDMSREDDGNFLSTTGSDYDGVSFLFELDLPAAGVYAWAYLVEDGSGNSITLDRGTFETLARPATGVDPRSDAKKTLDALTATLLGKASQDQLSHSLNGRSISRMSPAELLEWRDRAKRLYDEEQQQTEAAQGRAGAGSYGVRF